MIYFSGDTHGLTDFDKLALLKPRLTADDILIILGDCGIVFYSSEPTISQIKKPYEELPCTILYIDGNHENFPLLYGYPLVEVFGAKAHQVANNVFHICRGEILSIDGHTFFCLGGACSTDKGYRVEGYSWWKEEEITEEDLQHGLDNLARHEFKVDFILTHCIDSSIHYFIFHFRPDVCTNKLDVIDFRTQYKMWLFGHYHVDRYCSSKKACLYNKIGYFDEESETLFSYLE